MRKKTQIRTSRRSSKTGTSTSRPAQKPGLVERTRAAVTMVNSSINSEAAKVSAFMELFHPDYDKDKTRELVNDARRRQRGVA